jgi:hypothetical protein
MLCVPDDPGLDPGEDPGSRGHPIEPLRAGRHRFSAPRRAQDNYVIRGL